MIKIFVSLIKNTFQNIYLSDRFIKPIRVYILGVRIIEALLYSEIAEAEVIENR